jgi:ATPase subunit of ABC transporter with duplicated ATPase domains
MSIVVKQLVYMHPNREYLFKDLNFSVARGQKLSLIGPNGSGKSTLLELIAGKMSPASGEITTAAQPYYVPQHFGQYDDFTVARALGIELKLLALEAIINGDAAIEHFSTLDDDWNVEERALAALDHWNIGHLQLTQCMRTLSGGEKTKVFLSGIGIHHPEIILLDEPSNHLDVNGRLQLYELLQTTKMTILIVSHDRFLLNLLNLTYELSKNGMAIYGGNYDFYQEQKQEKIGALTAQEAHQQKDLRQAKLLAQEAAERKQKENARGQKKQAKKGMPRIMMGLMKNGAERSSSKLQDVHADKIKGIAGQLAETRQQLVTQSLLKMSFDQSNLHSGKVLITAAQLNFKYQDDNLWKTALNFQIRSGERIALLGCNGAGKTTLLKLILGKIKPTAGQLSVADFDYLYIDQEYELLDNNLTLVEQTVEFNKQHLPEHKLKTLLHQFLFNREMWDKKCGTLSGGEKMKLVFCCLMISNQAPDLIILDEPTNNLDIQSMEMIRDAIKDFKGTLIVIAHDAHFLDEIGVDRQIDLMHYRI